MSTGTWKSSILKSDCESATHKCGRCGTKYNFGGGCSFAKPLLLGCLLPIAGRTNIRTGRPT